MNNNLPSPPAFDKKGFIPRLPEDINYKIYTEYLWFDIEKKPICDEILEWFLRDERANRLDILPILDTLQNVIQCEHSMKYLCEKDKDIKYCYEYHYIENKKNFKLMNKLESFTQSVLMYKYH